LPRPLNLGIVFSINLKKLTRYIENVSEDLTLIVQITILYSNKEKGTIMAFTSMLNNLNNNNNNSVNNNQGI